MHIFEKWCLHLGPTKNMYLYFFHLLLIKHCNSKESKLTDAVSLFNSTAQLDQMSV